MAKGERKLADFTARCTTELDPSSSDNGFRNRRILLSTRRILLISEQFNRTTIPLTSIKRVGRGSGSSLPRGITTSSILYSHDGTSSTAVIRAPEKTNSRFLTVLLRALLDDTPVRVRHPAKVGGKVVDSEWEKATVRIRGGLTLRGVTRIELDTVEKARVDKRTVKEKSHPVLEVDHATEHSVVTTQIHSRDPRILHILNDFIQVEYQKVLKEVNSIHLGEDETNVVVAIYSGITENQLPDMLGKTEEEIGTLLQKLQEKGVLHGSGGNLALTSPGRILASRNF